MTLLLVYEYATVSEKITCGKVNFDDMLEKLYKGIDKFRLGELKQSDEDISFLKNVLLQGNEQNKDLNTFVTNKINEYLSVLKQEKDFFDGIPDKLGYRQKEEKNNNLLNNAVEATKVSTKIGTIAIMENSIEKQMNEQNLEVKNV